MSNYKVLIAEDNKLLANLTSETLSEFNIDNTIVNSGTELLTAYNLEYFDMILIDIMMPGISGFEVSKEIRKTNSHIPIIAFTSLEYEEIKDQLASSGINQYLSKPAKLEDLKALLNNYFRVVA